MAVRKVNGADFAKLKQMRQTCLEDPEQLAFIRQTARRIARKSLLERNILTEEELEESTSGE